MRNASLASVFVAILVTTYLGAFQATSQPEQADRKDSTVFARQNGLIAIKLDEANENGLLAVIDPKKKSIATYQVDKTSGKIALKSVRSIHWDLQLDEFNGTQPTPRQIKSTVQSPK